MNALTNKNRRGFEAARAASTNSNARKSRKVGAALFSGSILLSLGHNFYFTSHPRSTNGSFNLHAEHRCLIRRQYHPSTNLSVYVYRETSDGKPACSKPCQNCLFLLREAGVRSVHFVNSSGSFEKLTLRE